MANISQLVKKNREQILKEASHRGIPSYNDRYRTLTDTELIALIVEHDAYYTGRQDERDKREDRYVHSNEHLREQVQPDEKSRTLYRIQNNGDDSVYFVRITKEQDNFFDWLIHRDIVNSDDWEISTIENVPVDEP